MGKFTTYLILMSGLTILFHFAGLIEPGSTPNSQLLELILNPASMSFSSFFSTKILLAITTGAGLVAGIVIGFVTKNAELAVMSVVATWLATVMWDFLAVYTVLASQNFVIATLIFGPLMFMFSVTLADWWRGRDT